MSHSSRLITLAALFVSAPAFAQHPESCLCPWHTSSVTQESAQSGSAQQPETDSLEAPRMGPWGFDVSGMDTSVKPGDDFFAFTSGSWEKTATIPPDRARYGAFDKLRELSDKRVKALIEAFADEYATKDPASAASPAEQDKIKMAVLFKTFLDEQTVEALDAKPLQPELQTIAAIEDHPSFARYLGNRSGLSGASLFGLGIGDDSKNPEFNTLYLRQGGLGLSDRDFYLKENFAPQKQRYQQFVSQMLDMSGYAAKVGQSPDNLAAKIVDFETQIAQIHWTRAESRNRDKTYNPMTMAELTSFAPGFDWPAFFCGAEVMEVQGTETVLIGGDKVVIAQNSAIKEMAALFEKTDLNTLRHWAAFHYTSDSASLLSSRFVNASFEFRSKFLNGVPELRSRDKRAVSAVEAAMGEAIGREYVARFFSPEEKQAMEVLVSNLKLAMRARIEKLDWMSAETREKALAKLEKFGVKIGYPETWRDYSKLQIIPGDLFGNAARSAQFERAYQIEKLGQKVDKKLWGMTPQTVNAYYSSTRNEIVFPAAILQPPFFDLKADPAVNYGAIGGVIGHEITHGFDDQGRKSDGTGLLTDWWTPEDAAKFEAQAAVLGAQYEAYEFPELPGLRINGRVSMGENIADLGGVLLALDGYQLSLAGKEAPVIDGFTGAQRVFLGWAQVWRTMQRPDALRQQLVNGPHSPGRIRALAPLRNVDAWYKAFGISESDKLFVPPDKRVRIW